MFLATTITAPTDGKRLGCHIAAWSLQHAADLGRVWVRRGTHVPALMRYHRDTQGWSLTRVVQRRGQAMYLMARRTTSPTSHPAGT